MTRREMLTAFCKAGVPENGFWLGQVQDAENVNGIAMEGNAWIVYYRSEGELSNVYHCATLEEACDELYRRVMQSRQE